MLQKSLWWLGLVSFALLIGGVQSLGWWSRPAAVNARSPQDGPVDSASARRHVQGGPMHWRALVMHP